MLFREVSVGIEYLEDSSYLRVEKKNQYKLLKTLKSKKQMTRFDCYHWSRIHLVRLHTDVMVLVISSEQ